MLDLYHATRDDLIARVLGLRDVLADRERDNAALQAELAQQRVAIAHLTAQVGTPGGMPGLKPTEPSVRERPQRRKRATGAARRRMQATAR